MGYGSGYPFVYGGGSAEVDRIHAALRAAVGNTAGPPGGLEDLWRRSKARAIDIATRMVELAVMQRFPQTATVGLKRWEELLELAGDGYDEERRQLALYAFTRDSLADVPSLQQELQERVSSRLTIDPPNRLLSRVQQVGRVFMEWGNPEPALRVALFSDEYVWRVRYEREDNPGTAEEEYPRIPLEIRKGVDDIMQDRLPAWETYQLIDERTFFQMDGGTSGGSLLDQTVIR